MASFWKLLGFGVAGLGGPRDQRPPAGQRWELLLVHGHCREGTENSRSRTGTAEAVRWGA